MNEKVKALYSSVLSFLPDETYLKLVYALKMKRKLNLKNPTRFTEKIQWLKIHDRNPEYSRMVDKCAAKDYFREKIDEKYIIPTLGVYDRFDDIDFKTLPDKFVIKTNHDSGGVVICKDKSTFDVNKCKAFIEPRLKLKHYLFTREWAYKNVTPRILVEEYLDCLDQNEMIEYKIFCFNGEPGLFLVCQGGAHGAGRKNDYLDASFNRIPVRGTWPNYPGEINKPECFEELLSIARKLSTGIPQVRVDTYLIGNNIYIGEVTLYSDGGLCMFDPKEYDEKFGELIKLPK